jgi:hypothetical protein
MVARLTTLLAERLWFIYKQLANTLIYDPLGRVYDALSIQLEKNRIEPSIRQSYTFDFGPKELFNMVGISQDDGAMILKRMMTNKMIQVKNDKIHVVDVMDIKKQNNYFQKMQRIELARRGTLKMDF